MMKSTVLFAIMIASQLLTPTLGFASTTPSPRVAMTARQSSPLNFSKQSFRCSRSNAICLASSEDEVSELEAEPEQPKELSRLARLKNRLFPPKEDEDGMTFKQKLGKAGLSVVLSYGWVSNVSYSISVSIAWYIFSSQTGFSPLAPGQWKKFLAVYAGFFVFNNIVRPIRFGISVGVSTQFEKLIKKIQDTFGVRKGVAIFLTVFFANVVGTIALMCTGIYLASLAAGVPIFAK
jgi:hypothetical protein